MKRLVGRVLVVLLTSLTVAACGGGAAQQPSSSATGNNPSGPVKLGPAPKYLIAGASCSAAGSKIDPRGTCTVVISDGRLYSCPAASAKGLSPGSIARNHRCKVVGRYPRAWAKAVRQLAYTRVCLRRNGYRVAGGAAATTPPPTANQPIGNLSVATTPFSSLVTFYNSAKVASTHTTVPPRAKEVVTQVGPAVVQQVRTHPMPSVLSRFKACINAG